MSSWAAREVALSNGLEYVYIGNVPGHEAWNTFCPKCKKMVIQRSGYIIGEMHLKEEKCGYCGKAIPGIWKTVQLELRNSDKGQAFSEANLIGVDRRSF